MRKIIILVSLFIFISLFSINNLFADRVYLKSGEVLEGKIKEEKDSTHPSGHWLCQDAMMIWYENGSRCVYKDDIKRVEKQFKKPEGVALLAKKDRWGEAKYGYRTQLIPMIDKYVIGQPMEFSLVMKNASDSLKWYDSQRLQLNSLIIKDSMGKEAPCKIGSVMTAGRERPIDRGEIAILFGNRDIAEDYNISKPGKYSIQFRGGAYGDSENFSFPPSNIIEFEIKVTSKVKK